jgi:hypothetical protein
MCKQSVDRRSLVFGQAAPYPVVWTFRTFPRVEDARVAGDILQLTFDPTDLYKSAEDGGCPPDAFEVDFAVYMHDREIVFFETVFSLTVKIVPDEEAFLEAIERVLALKFKYSFGKRNPDLSRAILGYARKIPAMFSIASSCSSERDFSIAFETTEDLDTSVVLPERAELRNLEIDIPGASEEAYRVLAERLDQQVCRPIVQAQREMERSLGGVLG